MIHVLHLLWIVPLSGSLGFMACALLVANVRFDYLNTYSREVKRND